MPWTNNRGSALLKLESEGLDELQELRDRKVSGVRTALWNWTPKVRDAAAPRESKGRELAGTNFGLFSAL